MLYYTRHSAENARFQLVLKGALRGGRKRMKWKKTIAAATVFALVLGMCAGYGNVGKKKASASELFSTEEILAPVWEGNVSYQESVLAVEEEDGSLAPVSLLYPIGEIVSVKSASLLVAYEAEKDYSVRDGKLVIKKDGAIPVLTYSEFHPATGTSGFEDRNGGYVLWKEGSWFHSKQIVVTYTHAEGYAGYVPEGKGRLLERTLQKLEGDTLNLLVYGDSISTGANSSGHPSIHVSPNMPIYPELFAAGLKSLYGIETVNVYNASVGGTDSAWGLSNLRGGVLDKYEDIDLALLAFGMNDTVRDAESYARNMQKMAKGLKSKYEDADILLVAPMLPNRDAYTFYGNQAYFYGALKEYETQGIAAVDVTGVHAGLLEAKRYADMTGNNVNHANDYLARVYAQTLLKTLEISDYGKPGEEDSSGGDSDSSGGAQSSQSSSAGGASQSENASEGSDSNGCGSALGASAGIVGGLTALGILASKRKKNNDKK